MHRTPSGMVIVSPPVMVDSEHCTATIHSTQPGMVIAAALGKINVQKAGEKVSMHTNLIGYRQDSTRA